MKRLSLKVVKLAFIFICSFFIIWGCSSQVYMLDKPVNDPIMFADDNQNSDIDKVEDGGYSGVAGECPT